MTAVSDTYRQGEDCAGEEAAIRAAMASGEGYPEGGEVVGPLETIMLSNTSSAATGSELRNAERRDGDSTSPLSAADYRPGKCGNIAYS
jgi:hypothetical protein